MAQGGLFIATYRVQPLGTELELEFELPDGARVCAQGVVRWFREGAAAMSDRPGMGVEFTALPEAALVAIERFCRVRPPLYMEF